MFHVIQFLCAQKSFLYSSVLNFCLSFFPAPTCGRSLVKAQPWSYFNLLSRIVGGSQVEKGSYPWQVTLRTFSSGGLGTASGLDLSETHAAPRPIAFCLAHCHRAHECARIQVPYDVHQRSPRKGVLRTREGPMHYWLAPTTGNANLNFQPLRQKSHLKKLKISRILQF